MAEVGILFFKKGFVSILTKEHSHQFKKIVQVEFENDRLITLDLRSFFGIFCSNTPKASQ